MGYGEAGDVVLTVDIHNNNALFLNSISQVDHILFAMALAFLNTLFGTRPTRHGRRRRIGRTGFSPDAVRSKLITGCSLVYSAAVRWQLYGTWKRSWWILRAGISHGADEYVARVVRRG